MRNQSLARVLTVAALVLGSAQAFAEDGLLKDFDTLGGNDALMQNAKELNPDASIRVVQERIVTRRNRVEIAPEFTSVLGGDPYNKTTELGLNFHYHITPHWSVGLKYGYAFNQLRPEGENLIADTAATGKSQVPDIDYPKQEAMVMANWYPIYGKMNLYDLGVTHFDLYTVIGAGQVELKSGYTGTYTAGAGFGIWWSQHLTTRAELRYQTYQATRYSGPADMNLTVASVQIGYLL